MPIPRIDTARPPDPRKRILVAGVGNVFHGDDAFGVEVARRLMERELPQEVQVSDFGIRSYDLAYAILDGYEDVVLIDAVSRDAEAGTIFLLDADLDTLGVPGMVDGHSMNPNAIMSLVEMMGGFEGRLFVLGCVPSTLTSVNGEMTLSPAVRAAVDDAVELVARLVDQILRAEPEIQPLHEPSNPEVR